MWLKCIAVFYLSVQIFSQETKTNNVEILKEQFLNFESLSSVEDNEPVKSPEVISRSDSSGKLTFEYTDSYDPMTSRYAPQETDQRTKISDDEVPYVITEARLKEIRKHFMYPYFDKGGNEENEGDYQKEIQASTPRVHKNLNFQLPSFGFRYNYTRVTLNGYLEFSDPQEQETYPLVFPVKDWPNENDPSFLGIFYSKCRIGNLSVDDIDQRKPGVYFRIERDLRERTDKMGVEMRERVKWDIREGVIGAENFSPEHMIIATWKNISFSGGIDNALFITNTFQMVLATDEVYTYAMFNYLTLNWLSHTEAGGDPKDGTGGVPAFVGFNAGNGTRSYEYKPYSQNSAIRDLKKTGLGNGKPGRHYFRIDENIVLSSCNEDIDAARIDLVFSPERGNMLGGTIVNITGPCFNPNDVVKCKFDIADVVYGVVVSSNRAICIQPPLQIEGYVRLDIAVGSGTYKWKGKYYVESPATADEKIFFDDMSYYEKDPVEIGITWENQNLSTNANAVTSISLWGYRETSTKPEFLYITDLAANVPNTGSFKIIPSQYRNRTDELLTNIQFGFIQINSTETILVEGANDAKITPVIWSRPIPLAWYFGPQWERLYSENWTEYLCDDWLKNDRSLKNFTNELPQCPCTLQQALGDKGRFMPDFNCDKDSNPECYFNRPAIHCVKSGLPTLEGAEQQCCYDRNYALILSDNKKWGSYPRRSHNLGYTPWNENTKVPTLSQWSNDMIPRFVCCLWQDEGSVGCENLRLERRPVLDCVADVACQDEPGVAGIYDDSRIVTFDGLEYTFNGTGEFVLVRSENLKTRLEVQGRLEEMPTNAYGEVNTTQLTSVVARGNTSTVVEVRIRPQEARWRYHLDVIVDGRRIYFDQALFQHFSGVIVYTPTNIYNQSEVIVMFDSGAGVEVIENNGHMAAKVYLPESFINNTRGLFGNWTCDVLDDFTLPDGTKTSISTNSNEIARVCDDFGMKWIVDDARNDQKGAALFYREFGKTAAYYIHK